MGKGISAGHITRIQWDGHDLQVQTEMRPDSNPTITTLFVADGKVIASVERPWTVMDDQIKEQQRIVGYHNRLTKAMKRLRDERAITIEDLGVLAGRIVLVALRKLSSFSSEVFSLLPGARWVAVADENGHSIEAAPERDSGKNWCGLASGLRKHAEKISAVFDISRLEDLSVRTKDTYILLVPKGTSSAIAEVSAEDFPSAHQMMLRLTPETG